MKPAPTLTSFHYIMNPGNVEKLGILIIRGIFRALETTSDGI